MIGKFRFVLISLLLFFLFYGYSYGQRSKSKMFRTGTMDELNRIAIETEKDFFFFIWEDKEEALTTYYRDTIFSNRLISNKMKDQFVCVTAAKSSEIGNSFTKQFHQTEFPALMFVGWKKGDEIYSLEGRLEIDQVLDQLERVQYRK